MRDRKFLELPVGDETIEVEVLADEDMPEHAMVLCVREDEQSPEIAAAFPDNERGPCAGGCGHVVVWRPYQSERYAKICFHCLGEVLKSARN